MKHKRTVLEVSILQDPVPGWGNNQEDHKELLQSHLNDMIPWYKPEVKILREEEVDE